MVMLPTEEELGQRSMREWVEDMHESMGYLVPPAKLVQETWENEVLPAIVVEGRGGRPEISIEKLKGEMYELLWARNEAQKVYHHITSGCTANLTVSAEGIIALAERFIEERIAEAVKDALKKRDGQ